MLSGITRVEKVKRRGLRGTNFNKFSIKSLKIAQNTTDIYDFLVQSPNMFKVSKIFIKIKLKFVEGALF